MSVCVCVCVCVSVCVSVCVCVCVCVPDAVKLPTSIKGDGLFSCIYSVYTCNKNF